MTMDDITKGTILYILAAILIAVFVYELIEGSNYVACVNSGINLTCVRPWWVLP